MICRCPDCPRMQDCETCGNTRYVMRNGHGRITRSATPKEMLDQLRSKPVIPQRKPTRFPRFT